MNDMSNTPVMPAGPKPFFQVWMDALTKPSESTFAEMAASPNAKATTAYLWIFIGYLIEFFLSSLVQGVAMRRVLEQYGNGGQFANGFGGGLITAICGAPIIAVVATIFFAIGTAIIQWVAKMFGGKGNSGQLAYVLAAILAPFSIVAGVLGLLSAIPFIGLCFSIIVAVAGLYILVLEIMAIKGVNQFGWGAAIGALFIPGLAIGFLCACLVGGLMLFGSAIENAFKTINQSLVAP